MAADARKPAHRVGNGPADRLEWLDRRPVHSKPPGGARLLPAAVPHPAERGVEYFVEMNGSHVP